ncbi:unnamed protein product [Meganyctiphanes norvegica]|uniref:SDE2-like domain-containing protein n=1 Tax=Meganyctiphanes norvegica TaxID=48144 RepID=A0AAV2S7V2_MEGNR
MVHVVSHISGQRRTWCLPSSLLTHSEIINALEEREGAADNVLLQTEGRVLDDDVDIDCDITVIATLRLPGGKGGFGSMLRAIGAQIEKTTNREACRDLSGRRLRDINEEKRLKDYINKKAEREKEAMERKRRRLEELNHTPKHIFQDETYYQQRELIEKNLHDALEKGAEAAKKASTSGTKRSCDEKSTPNKKVKFNGKRQYGFIDLDDSSSDEESDEDIESGKGHIASQKSYKENSTEVGSSNSSEILTKVETPSNATEGVQPVAVEDDVRDEEANKKDEI